MLARVCASALVLAAFLCGSLVSSFAVDASPSPVPVTREDLEEIIGDPGDSRVWDFSGSTRFSLSDGSTPFVNATVFPSTGSPLACDISLGALDHDPSTGDAVQHFECVPSVPVPLSSLKSSVSDPAFTFGMPSLHVSLDAHLFEYDFPAGSSVYWSLAIGQPSGVGLSPTPPAGLFDSLNMISPSPPLVSGDCHARVEYGRRSNGVIVPGSSGVVEVVIPYHVVTDPEENYWYLSIEVDPVSLSVPAGLTPENIELYGFSRPLSWSFRYPTRTSSTSTVSIFDFPFPFSSTLTVTAAPQNVYFYLREILANMGANPSGPTLDAILAKLSDIYSDTQNLSATVALIPGLLNSLPDMASDISAIRSALENFDKNQNALASFTPSPETSAAHSEAEALLGEQDSFDQQEQQFVDGLNSSMAAVNFEDYHVPDAFQWGIGYVSGKFNEIYEALGEWKIFYLLPLAIGLAFAIVGGLSRSDIGRKFRDGENSGGG